MGSREEQDIVVGIAPALEFLIENREKLIACFNIYFQLPSFEAPSHRRYYHAYLQRPYHMTI